MVEDLEADQEADMVEDLEVDMVVDQEVDQVVDQEEVMAAHSISNMDSAVKLPTSEGSSLMPRKLNFVESFLFYEIK